MSKLTNDGITHRMLYSCTQMATGRQRVVFIRQRLKELRVYFRSCKKVIHTCAGRRRRWRRSGLWSLRTSLISTRSAYNSTACQKSIN